MLTKTAEKKLIARTLRHRYGFAPPAAEVVLFTEQNAALGVHFEVGGHGYYLRDGAIVEGAHQANLAERAMVEHAQACAAIAGPGRV